MRQRPLFTVLCVAGTIASGVFLNGQVGPAPPRPTLVTLDKADAARLVEAGRAAVQVEMPAGVELKLWAPDGLIADPVALEVTPDGTVYVAGTQRNNLPLDIRGHQDWMTTAHTMKTVADLRRFYSDVMSPANSAKNGWIPDANGDGSKDIRDLAEFKERVYRVTDTDGDGIADKSQIVYEGFNDDPTWDTIGGVLLDDNKDLVVVVPPGVYRLHDAKGDGRFSQRSTIAEGMNIHPAFGGHGVSGVLMGPDGRLYWEVGDIGLHVTDRSGRIWSYPNQGAVMRSDPDGSNFEVFATGIRNLQEFSFDEHGNLISVDNDGDYPSEAERVVYLPWGSETGWRSTWQYGKYTDPKNNKYNVWIDEQVFKPRFEGRTARVLAPIANWHAGPSGMAYNPGTALSDAWKNHFFVTSFVGSASTARVYAFKLEEKGAGFAMGPEQTLLKGILAVGLRIGPDGALYVTDWITGWDSKNKGRIWKLDTPETANSAIRKDVRTLLGDDFSKGATPEIAQLLSHADMRVRQKAQFDLVRRGESAALLAAARSKTGGLARLHGLWGLAQLARKDASKGAVFAEFLTDQDGEIRAQAARMIGDVKIAALAPKVLPLLMDTTPRARYFAAEAIARTVHKPGGPAIVDMLADNDGHDLYIQHVGAIALAAIGDAKALEALSTHAKAAVRSAAVVALGRMKHAGVARFLKDADAAIATDAARAVNDDGSIAGAVPALAATLTDTPLTGEPYLRRALNANLRVGSRDAVDRVAAFAADVKRPEALRVEAVSILGVWVAPSPLDRVDGFYLAPFAVQPASTTPRDGTAARAAIERMLASMPADATEKVKVALAEAAGRSGAAGAAPALLAMLKNDASQAVRLAALEALRLSKGGNPDELMQIAFADKSPAVRRAAIVILPTLPISAAAKTQQLAALYAKGSTAEKQGVIEVLGNLKSPESRQVLQGYVDQLNAGTLPSELQVDLLEAVQADGSETLAKGLETYRTAKKADTLVQAFAEALAKGGDFRGGQRVVTDNPAAECTRCHTIRGRGSDVGPDLSRIGSTLTRPQLVEAFLAPNARIAPGFGVVSVTLKNGDKADGTLRSETDTEVVLLTGTPPAERKIAKADIASRTDPVSAMPPLGLILKPREVRDLVEFLAGMR
jgi:putative heme-binding domain-containing protein